jgi:shikimate kinase
VVFLDVSPEVAAHRVGDARTRPLLSGDPIGKLTALAVERRAAYLEVADFVVSVDDRTPGAVVGAILSLMEVAS